MTANGRKNTEELWNVFEKTGTVDAYLNYRAGLSVLEDRSEGEDHLADINGRTGHPAESDAEG